MCVVLSLVFSGSFDSVSCGKVLHLLKKTLCVLVNMYIVIVDEF